ncbi:hypothetical protein ACFLRY_04915, partial [Bacteroidota bacterium]
HVSNFIEHLHLKLIKMKTLSRSIEELNGTFTSLNNSELSNILGGNNGNGNNAGNPNANANSSNYPGEDDDDDIWM